MKTQINKGNLFALMPLLVFLVLFFVYNKYIDRKKEERMRKKEG